MTAYRALRELRYPTDPEIIAKLVAGENPPLRARHMKVVAAGIVVDDLPAESIPVLIEKGWIEEAHPHAERGPAPRRAFGGAAK